MLEYQASALFYRLALQYDANVWADRAPVHVHPPGSSPLAWGIWWYIAEDSAEHARPGKGR